MARDPLPVLQAIRRRSVEQARYALATCLTAEARIKDQLLSLDDAARRDREVSRVWQDAHWFLEDYAARQEAIRVARRNVGLNLAAAEARSLSARTVVASARTAAEAVDQFVQERSAAAQTEAAKREQHLLDDISRARHAVHVRGTVA